MLVAGSHAVDIHDPMVCVKKSSGSISKGLDYSIASLEISEAQQCLKLLVYDHLRWGRLRPWNRDTADICL